MGAQLASRESSLEALITFIGESGGLSKVIVHTHYDNSTLMYAVSFPIRQGNFCLLMLRNWRPLVEFGLTITSRHSKSQFSCRFWQLDYEHSKLENLLRSACFPLQLTHIWDAYRSWMIWIRCDRFSTHRHFNQSLFAGSFKRYLFFI